jgi:phi13 family phage major tail protein
MVNKVKYGLKNVHYSKLTEGETDTYATPVRIPGAVNISLSPVGDTTPFVADDEDFFTVVGNNGYDGTLEIATVPESFAKDILGEAEDANGVAFESKDAAPQHFALLFEFDGDVNKTKHLFYKCLATRPNVEGSATTNKEVKTSTLNLTCRPNSAGHTKASTKSTTDSEAAEGWYDAVYTYVAPSMGT